MAQDDVSVVFGANIAGLVAGVEEVKSHLQSIGGSAAAVTEAFTGIGEVLAGIFAVDKLDQFIEHIGDLGLQVERTSKQLGLTAEQVSVLNYAAETNDVSTSQMRNSLERLTVGLEAAERGGNKQADALKLMGINAQEFIAKGGTMADLIEQVSKRTAELSGKTNLAAAYIALMGRSGADAIPVFEEIGRNTEELRAKVAAAGLAFNPGFVEAIAETRKANIDLKEATSGLGASIFSILKPAIDVGIIGLRGLVQSLSESTQYGGTLWGILEGLTGAFLILETGAIAVADAIKLVFTVLLSFINAALSEVGGAAQALYDIAHGNVQKAVADIKAGHDQAKQILKTGGEQVSNDLTDTLGKMKKSWGDYWKDITTGNEKTNKEITSGGFSSGGKGPALTGSDSAEAESRKKLMDEDIATHKKMLELELTDDGDNLRAKMQHAQAYYDWLKGKYSQNKDAMLDAARKISEIQNQEIKKEERSWEQFFGAFNSGLLNMIRGTNTWKQALSNAFYNLLGNWLKVLEKMAAHWIATEVVKTEATNAGNAARVVSDKTAAAASGGFSSANAIKTITGDAAKAYAGTYGFLAPEMGPFAAIPAGVAFAAVMGMEALVPSFAVGTWNVPHDMTAQLHAGERVMTAEENRSYSANGGGGGAIEMHFYGPTDKQYFMQNADHIAAALGKASRGQNPNIMKGLK